jgi:hypothetical protein
MAVAADNALRPGTVPGIISAVTVDQLTVSFLALVVAIVALLFGPGLATRGFKAVRDRFKARTLRNRQLDEFFRQAAMFLDGLQLFIASTWRWGPSVPNYAAGGAFPDYTLSAVNDELRAVVREAQELYVAHSQKEGAAAQSKEEVLDRVAALQERFWVATEAFAKSEWRIGWRKLLRDLRSLRIPDSERKRILAFQAPVRELPKSSDEDHLWQEALWRSLTAYEQEVLRKLWSREDRFVFLRECGPWKARWGMEEWNTVIHNLTSLRLIVEGRRHVPEATSFFVGAPTMYLTDRGATLMTWLSRQEPPADPLLNTPAASIQYGLMWPEIEPNEREFLALLWAQPDTFAADALVRTLERTWGVPAFNAAVHSLRGARKLIDHWNHGTKGPVWSLTGAGRDLMTWREKNPSV